MNRRRNALFVFIGLVAFCALIGVLFSLEIIRKEGVEGLWKRKKGLIEKVRPDAGPSLDEAEKRVRESFHSRDRQSQK